LQVRVPKTSRGHLEPRMNTEGTRTESDSPCKSVSVRGLPSTSIGVIRVRSPKAGISACSSWFLLNRSGLEKRWPQCGGSNGRANLPVSLARYRFLARSAGASRSHGERGVWP
jgi:hypothetical protein